MEQQQFKWWVDASGGYNLDKFLHDLASRVIQGPSQEISVWGVDQDNSAEFKVSTNADLEEMINGRLHNQCLNLYVEVIDKVEGNSSKDSNITTQRCQSSTCGGSNEEVGDSRQEEYNEINVDWSLLNIETEDGDGASLLDEDKVYVAMGLREEDERAEDIAKGPPDVPVIPVDVQKDIDEACMVVHDDGPHESSRTWDVEDPDMDVGTIYPSMDDFRMAVKQHAIVNEFELGTEKSDRSRFRGYCSVDGCPWKIRARTQVDKSVRVLTPFFFYITCK